jgi:hypothetical protein
MNCSRLHLLSPLLYREITPLPSGRGEFFGPPAAGQAGPGDSSGPEPFPETLFHFRINRSRAFAMEADGNDYLESLIAAGQADANGGLELPAGEYFFTQIREKLDGEAFVGMALELQKEGLWERLRLAETVYFRTLWEDGAPVSQILRPLAPLS